MKAVLRFDLSDPDDARAHKLALAAPNLLSAVWNYDQLLRSKAKHGGDKGAEDARALLLEKLDEYGINMDDLT